MSAGVGSQYYSAFNPLDIGGCALWLDAADQSTLTLSGTNVTQWRDKSGNNYHQAQSTTANQPIYTTFSNRPYVSYVAASSNFTSNTSMGIDYRNSQIFLVFQRRAAMSGGIFSPLTVGQSGDWTRTDGFTIIGLVEVASAGSGANDGTTSNTNLTSYRFTISNNNLTTFRDFGSSSVITRAMGLTANPNGLYLGIRRDGASLNFPGDVYFGEALVFNRLLTTGENQLIEGYLSRKWFRLPYFYVLPTQITGCQVWLDGTDTTTFDLSGSSITRWRDKSGNLRHATPTSNLPVYTSNVFNGLSAPVFSNSAMILPAYVIAPTNALSVFAVSRQTGVLGAGNSEILITAVGFQYFDLFNKTNDGSYFGRVNLNSFERTIRDSSLLSNNSMVSAVTDGTTFFGYYNGSQSSSSSVGTISFSLNTSTQWVITGTQFIGAVCEIVVFNRNVTTTERQQVEGYLASKWGLQGNLPSSHPYYSVLGVPTTHPYFSIVPVTRQFAPIDIPNCALWLDGADPNSMTISTSANGSATLSQYVTTSAQNVSYNIPFTSLSSFIGGTTVMNGSAINFGNGTPGVFAPSASNGVWYAIDSGYTKAVKVQFALSGTTLTVQGLSAGFGATAGVSPLNSGAVNDVCYNTYSPTTIATSSSTASYGVASFTMNYTVAGNNFVSRWNDKSGNARNFTASGIGATWSSTSPGLTFLSNFYTSSYSAAVTNETMFIVVKYQNSGFMIGSSVAGGREVASSSLTQFGIANAGNAWGATTPSNSAYSNTPYLVTTIITAGSNTQLALNGSTSFVSSNITAFSAGTTQLGREGTTNFQFQGTIYEVIAYSTVLTTIQRQQIEGYLTKKWGFQPSIASPLTAPTQITGCSWWLDGADPLGTGTPPSVNTSLGTWYDKSGNSRNASGGGGGTYVTGGVSFNGSSQFYTMTVPYSSNYSIFLVATNTSISQAYFFSRSGVGGGQPTFIQSYTGSALEWYEGSDRAVIATTPASPFLASVVHTQGSTIVGYYFGNQAFSIPQTATYIASNWSHLAQSSINTNWYGGIIRELIFFSNVLTTTQRQQVEGYLANKWGFTSSLPPTHPYANTGLPTTHPYVSRNPRTIVFNPRQITGCALWLDAADPTSMTFSGSNVTQWNDKSGNAKHAIQATISNQPVYQSNSINGMPSIQFPAISRNNLVCFDIPAFDFGTSARTAFFVIRNNYVSGTPGSSPVWFWPKTGNGTNALSLAGWMFASVQGQASGATATYNRNQNILVGYRFGITSAFEELFSNTISVGTATKTTGGSSYSNATSGYRIGALDNADVGSSTYWFDGNIGEILLFNRAVTNSERQQIEGYLAWKWALNGGSLSSLSVALSFTPTQISGCALWLDAADSNSMTLQGIASLSQYITTTDQSVSYTGTLSSLSSLTGGPCVMNGPAINFGNGSPGVFAPSASIGVWYAIDTGYTKVVKLQFTLAGTTLYVKALSAGYNASGGISPTNSGATNDTAYATYSPATIATSGSSGSYGVSSFTMYFTSSSGPYVTQLRDKTQSIIFTPQGSSSYLTFSSNTFPSGLPSLYFNNTTGENVSLLGTLAQPSNFSMFVVWKNATQRSGSYRNIFGWTFVSTNPNPGAFNFGYTGTQTGSNIGIWDTYTGTVGTLLAVSNQSNYVGYAQYGTPSVSLNGNTPSASSMTTTAGGTNLYIGGIIPNNQTVSMNFGEAIVYNSILSTLQRQQVETYLINKWGINSSNIPSTHPYSKIQPGMGFPLNTSITFTYAWYGSTNGGSGRNVTSTVQNTYDSGSSTITLGNSTFGDPQPGIVKYTWITYTKIGVSYSIGPYNEGTVLTFSTL